MKTCLFDFLLGGSLGVRLGGSLGVRLGRPAIVLGVLWAFVGISAFICGVFGHSLGGLWTFVCQGIRLARLCGALRAL